MRKTLENMIFDCIVETKDEIDTKNFIETLTKFIEKDFFRQCRFCKYNEEEYEIDCAIDDVECIDGITKYLEEAFKEE